MADKAKPGDLLKLAKGEGIFIDPETKFEVFNKNEAKLGDTVGKATHLAIQSGGLLIVKSSTSKNNEGDGSDLPEDLPGRDAFIEAGLDWAAVQKLDFNVDKVKGIGAATIKALHEWAEQNRPK